MNYNEFKKNALNFYVENYMFSKIKNKNYIYKEYNDFYFIIYIVKSNFDNHYKILSNYYFKELHKNSELISPDNCDELIHTDLQQPEDLFNEQLINSKSDDEIFCLLDKIFKKLDQNFTKNGLNHIYKIQSNKTLYTFKPSARNYLFRKINK